MDDTDGPRMNRQAFSVGRLSDPDDTVAYWRDRTPEERLQALEVTRRILYGYTDATGRLRRVLSVARLGDDEAHK